MDYVQKHNNRINIPLSQTFRSYRPDVFVYSTNAVKCVHGPMNPPMKVYRGGGAKRHVFLTSALHEGQSLALCSRCSAPLVPLDTNQGCP
jgi:hypothetical protein